MRLKLRKRSSDCEADSPDLSYMQWILSHVSANGWAVPGVLGCGVAPPWAYSIGLWATFGHPDLAAFGRPLDHLAVIVKSLCRRVADDEAVSAGDVLDDVCPSRLAIRAIHDSWRLTPLFHASDQFHGYIRPPIYQVAWADVDGNFPGDLRYDPALADAQPMLWLPVDDHPPGPWTHLKSATTSFRSSSPRSSTAP